MRFRMACVCVNQIRFFQMLLCMSSCCYGVVARLEFASRWHIDVAVCVGFIGCSFCPSFGCGSVIVDNCFAGVVVKH